MGGLSKHMMHPCDNLKLSRKDVLIMMMQTTSPRCRKVEKVDGLNIHFLNVQGELRMARNNKDLLTGGFGPGDLENRFNKKVADIYEEAYHRALEANVIDFIPTWQRQHVTLNCECVYGTPNIINYGEVSMVVAHNWWHWTEEDSHYSLDYVDNEFPQDFNFTNRFFPDNELKVELPGNFIDWEQIDKELDKVFRGCGTIRELYQLNFVERVANTWGIGFIRENQDAMRELFNRFFDKQTMNLRVLRKMIAVGDGGTLDNILLSKDSIVKDVKADLEKFILDWGQLILRNCSNYLNEWNPKATILMNEVLKKAKDTNLYKMNQKRMSDMHPNPLEGIVMEYNGELYKWTGSFAPINQIVGSWIRK